MFALRSLCSHQLWPGVPITLAKGISSVNLSKGIPNEALASESLKHNWQSTDRNQSCWTSLDITANGAFPQEIKCKWKCLRLTQRACFINIYQVILLHWLAFASRERLCRCLHACIQCAESFAQGHQGFFPAAQSCSQLIIGGPDKNTALCYYKRMNVMNHNALLFPRSDHHS